MDEPLIERSLLEVRQVANYVIRQVCDPNDGSVDSGFSLVLSRASKSLKRGSMD